VYTLGKEQSTGLTIKVMQSQYTEPQVPFQTQMLIVFSHVAELTQIQQCYLCHTKYNTNI